MKDIVRRKIKSCDLIKFLRMVIYLLDVKLVLNICILVKVSIVNVDVNRNEVYDGRVVILFNNILVN